MSWNVQFVLRTPKRKNEMPPPKHVMTNSNTLEEIKFGETSNSKAGSANNIDLTLSPVQEERILQPHRIGHS